MSDTEKEVVSAEPGLSQEANEVKNLTNRDIKWRARAKELRSELETVKVKSENQIKQTEEQVKTALKMKEQSEGKWMQAEIRAEAIAAGLKDLDLVALIDTSSVKIDDNGKMVGLKEAISDFKAKKPAFFGEEKKVSTSTNAAMPVDTAPKVKNAYDYTPEEWRKNLKARFMNGRF